MNHIPTDTECSPVFSFEVKELSEDGIFTGYAAVYGNKDLGGDVLEREAFAENLTEHKGKVPILFNHSWMRPIGYGLEAKEDDHGLLVVGEFTLDSTDGRDAYATARHAQKRKQPHGLSIGYSIRGEDGAEMRGQVRRLKKLNLHEYSMAVFPMNPKARIREVKSGATLRECEEYLRGYGMSGSEAKRFLSAVEVARDVSTYAADPPQRDVSGDFASFLNDARDFTLKLRLKEFSRG
jgi:HK97 family phage prohead protease